MKLLFLDADGTLFHHEGYIPKSAIEACQQAQKNGHKICLATGRQNMEIYSDLLKVDYDGRITGAGAYVEAEGNLLYQENFSASQKQQLLDYFKEHQIPALFESSNALFVSQSTLEQLEAITKKACAGLDPVSYQKHGMVQILRNTKVVSNFSSCEFNKITFLSSATPYQQIAKDLGKDFDVIPATFEPLGKESGEVASLTISKASGIHLLQDYWHVDKADCIAIGDGFNDICMFDHVGTSIAMGNAALGVQKKADWVTDTLEQDGIQKAFKKLHVIE